MGSSYSKNRTTEVHHHFYGSAKPVYGQSANYVHHHPSQPVFRQNGNNAQGYNGSSSIGNGFNSAYTSYDPSKLNNAYQKFPSNSQNKGSNWQQKNYAQNMQYGHKQEVNYPKTSIQERKPEINQKEAKELGEEELRLQKMIEEYQQGIQKAKQYGRKMQDPTRYDQFKKQALEVYIKRLQEMNLPEKDVEDDQKCYKLIVGKVSSGKSSLLNKLFGLNLEVGMGETTEEARIILDEGGVQVYDTPGQNERFNTFNLENIQLIASVNEIFVCYPDSLKNIEHLARVICGVKPKHTVFLRTYCDMASKSDKKTLEEEIAEDYRVLEHWGITGVKIYPTSAIKDGFANEHVRDLILHYPKK